MLAIKTNFWYKALIIAILLPGVVFLAYRVYSCRMQLEPAVSVHDFGTLMPGESRSTNIEFRNNSTMPAHLNSVRASCSCVDSRTEPQVVQPGGEVQIDVNISAVGLNVSRDDSSGKDITKWVIVDFHDDFGNEKQFPIQLKARLRPPLAFKPERMQFSRDGTEISTVVLVVNRLQMSAIDFKSLELVGPGYFVIRKTKKTADEAVFAVELLQDLRPIYLQWLQLRYSIGSEIRTIRIPANYLLAPE